MPSAHYYFHPSGALHELFPFLSSEGHLFKYYSFSAFSSRSPNLTGASFKYPLINLWSLRSHVSKFPQVSSFIFQVFPVNCAFATFFFNSMVLCSRFLFLCVHINLFVVSILPVVHWRPSQDYAISLLNPFQWEYVVCRIRCLSSI